LPAVTAGMVAFPLPFELTAAILRSWYIPEQSTCDPTAPMP
jgi:hypothetical protein